MFRQEYSWELEWSGVVQTGSCGEGAAQVPEAPVLKAANCPAIIERETNALRSRDDKSCNTCLRWIVRLLSAGSETLAGGQMSANVG